MGMKWILDEQFDAQNPGLTISVYAVTMFVAHLNQMNSTVLHRTLPQDSETVAKYVLRTEARELGLVERRPKKTNQAQLRLFPSDD